MPTLYSLFFAFVVLVYATRSVASPSSNDVAIFCVGNCSSPSPPRPPGIRAGIAMCGGHMYPGVLNVSTDIHAYRFLIERANGGDVVVLTADPVDTPCDLYNEFLMENVSTTRRPRSVSTICFQRREDSFNSTVRALLQSAAVVFITGGDQGVYYKYWKSSPVSELVSKIPLIGGSSAGLAVQGEIVFDALHGSVDSDEALKYPMDSEISLTKDMFRLPWMHSVITDTHFIQRNRMGRLITFCARAMLNEWGSQFGVLGVGVSEHTAVLIDGESGNATFSGTGPVYFVKASSKPTACNRDSGLMYSNVSLYKWDPIATPGASVSFDEGWAIRGLETYNISAKSGLLHSTAPGGGIYGDS
eukprot:g4363.t1